MIRKNSITASIGIADEYAVKGLVVSALPGTVLYESNRFVQQAVLSSFDQPYIPASVGAETDYYEHFADWAETTSTGDHTRQTLHDQFHDHVVQTLTQSVLKHIGYAKNVVKPVIMDYVEKVQTQLQATTPPSAASQFTIECLDLPDVLSELDFKEVLRPYKGRSALKPSATITLTAKSDDELLALLQWGEQGIDASLIAWYTRKGPAWFQTVWQSFFAVPGDGTPVLTADTVLGMNPFDRADIGLTLYLWSRRLYDEVDSGVKGLSLASYQAKIAEIRDFGGTLLDEAMRRLSLYDQNQTLVVDTIPNRKLLRVYGAAYRNWLEGGGAPELLFGLLLTGRRVFNRASIDELIPELKQRWQTFVMFHNAAESNRAFDVFKSILTSQFEQSLLEPMRDEQAFIERTPQYHDTVRRKFNEELNQLSSTGMKCLNRTALKLLCRSRFYYTGAEAILSDIQDAADMNPDIDVREAALLATIHYVTDYVADQLTLVRE